MADFDVNQIYDVDGAGGPNSTTVELGEVEYTRLVSAYGVLMAMNKAAAVIEFDLTGTIITANENFLSAMGYRLEEIKGQHHRIFVDTAYAQSPDYAQFWRRLAAGEHIGGDFQRFAKSGTEVWIRATYNPVVTSDGEMVKFVKVAHDITAEKQVQIATQAAMRRLSELQMAEISHTALQNISGSSAQIGQLIQMIEEIAGRSNLLGINAEIEASHAGAAGAGFSVVANEMRRLSERSAQAVVEIRDLIEASRTAIEKGQSDIATVSEKAAGLINEVVALQDEEGEARASAVQSILAQLDRNAA